MPFVFNVTPFAFLLCIITLGMLFEASHLYLYNRDISEALYKQNTRENCTYYTHTQKDHFFKLKTEYTKSISHKTCFDLMYYWRKFSVIL